MATSALFRKLYQFLTWSTLAGLVITVALVLRKGPAPAVPFDPQAVARAERKFAAADLAKTSGQSAQVQLDRTELNSYLQNLQREAQSADPSAPTPQPNPGAAPSASPAAGPPPSSDPVAALTEAGAPNLEEVQSSVKDVKVDIDGDIVKAYVIFDFHGKDLSLELAGHLRAQNGYLKFDPVSGSIGSMPLPQSALQAAVEKMMDSPENREKLRLPADISDIQIANGQALITYK